MPTKAIINKDKDNRFSDILAIFHAFGSSSDFASIKIGMSVVDNVAARIKVISWGMVVAAKKASISIPAPKVNARRKRLK